MTKSNVHLIADETLGYIAIIDGTRYRLVERKAKVGEKVIYTADSSEIGVNNGDIVVASNVDIDGYVGFRCGAINPKNYRVLVPIEPLVTVDATQCSEAVLDMLANLARRVTQLESQLRDTQVNVQTFAEITESNTQDIADLDERTQPLVEPKQAAEHLLRKIAKLIEEEGPKGGDAE